MQNDIHRGHVPRALIRIGGQWALVESYSLNINNKGEAQSCRIRIPLENIDSVVFNDPQILGSMHAVEIWSGYIEDVGDTEKQIAELRKIIARKASQPYLVKRFDGFVSQPEWTWGEEGEYVDLDCLDWSSVLREYKFFVNLEGGDTEVRAILKKIQSDLKGITIDFDDYPGSVRLGDFDNVDNKITYNCGGKTYWDMIDDCAKKLGYIVICENRTIKLTSQKKSPMIWNMYYGPEQRQELVNDQPRGQFFKNVQIRYGQKGRLDKSNVVIECVGTNKKEKGTAQQVRVIYPEDQAITSVTKYEYISVPGDVRETQLKIIAEHRYRQLASRLMTGSLELPFANNYLNLWDIVEFVPDESKDSMHFLKGYWFNVCSISEEFNKSGFTQRVEFESDPTLEKTVKRKIAPSYKSKPIFGFKSIDAQINDFLSGGNNILEIDLKKGLSGGI